MYREINRFPALKSDLESASDIIRIFNRSSDDLIRVSDLFRKELLARLPEGERGPSGHNRPSIRLWRQRLIESFTSPIISASRRDSHLSMSILFDHPSVNEDLGGDVLSWFQYGTDPHRVPDAETKVVFWWGSPLKWPAYKGKPGVRSSTNAKYWGSSTEDRGYWARPYGDFEGEAGEAIKRMEEDVVDKTYSASVTRPLDGSSYLRRVS